MISTSDDEKGIGIEVFYTNTKGIGGKLRKSAEDFIVEEISSRPEKDEEGEYTILNIRAKNWETNRLIRQISRKLAISRNRIGFAGTKDRRAVTTQLLSIRAPVDNIKRLSLKDLEIMDIYPSRKGLGLGDLVGNSFDIVINDIECSKEEAEKLMKIIQEELEILGGFPNFFGHQRFGALRPITHIVGRKIIEGDFKGAVQTYIGNPVELEGPETNEARIAYEKGMEYSEVLKLFPKHLGFERAMLNHLVVNDDDFVGAIGVLPKNLSMMFVHAYQSYIFNRILSLRIKKGLLSSEPLIGDMVLPADAYGVPDHKKWIEVQEHNFEKIKKKIAQKKAYISGILPGAEVELAKGEQGEIEMQVIKEEGFLPRDYIIPQIKGLSSKGMRRELISPASDFKFELEREGIRMRFKLNKGCYATALLREFMKTDMLNY